jgi:hypothetical protein
MKQQVRVNIRNTFIIKPHSVVDLITNSSSEIFVCETTKTLDIVNELLQDMLTLHNKIHETNFSFSDCFLEPYMIMENNFEKYFIDYVLGWNTTPYKYMLLSYYDFADKHRINTEPWSFDIPVDSNGYKKRREIIKKDYDKYLDDWKKENYESLKKDSIGLIIIESASDNTIPYPLFELIESAFNGNRYHLG